MKPTSIRLSKEITEKIEATGMKQTTFILQAIEEKLGIKTKQSMSDLYQMLNAQEKRIANLETQLSYLTLKQGEPITSTQKAQNYQNDRKQEVLSKLVEAIQNNPNETQKTKIATIAGLDRRTVAKYWEEAQALSLSDSEK